MTLMLPIPDPCLCRMTLMLPIPNPCLCRILRPMPLMPYTTLMLPIPNPCLWRILRPMPLMPLMPHMPLMHPIPNPCLFCRVLRPMPLKQQPPCVNLMPLMTLMTLMHPIPNPCLSHILNQQPLRVRPMPLMPCKHDPNTPYPEPVSLAHPAANAPIASLPEPAAPVAAEPRDTQALDALADGLASPSHADRPAASSGRDALSGAGAPPSRARRSVQGRQVHGDTFMWGVFRLTWSSPEKRGPHGSWQATCPYHRASHVTGCKKSIALSSATPEEKTRCCNLLKLWCLQAPQHERRSSHGTSQPRQLELLDECVLDARLASLPPVPASVRTDEELDAAAIAAPRAKGKAKARVKAKESSRPKAKSKPKASASAKSRAASSPMDEAASKTLQLLSRLTHQAQILQPPGPLVPAPAAEAHTL